MNKAEFDNKSIDLSKSFRRSFSKKASQLVESDDSHDLSDESATPQDRVLKLAQSNRSLNMRKSNSVTPGEPDFAARLSEKGV